MTQLHETPPPPALTQEKFPFKIFRVFKSWTPTTEILIVSSLFVLAVLIRLWRLFQSPGFLEFNELQITMQLVNGERFPLYSQHPHIGALINYIVAVAFWILGTHYWVPRTVILVMGSLTIPLVYFLGKRWFDSSTALLAALMLAGSMYHIFHLSHLPWSNSMTPFFVICCLLSFAKSLQDQKPIWLIVSGFLFGLALQTHPSVIALIPALMGIFLLYGDKQWLRRPSPYLSVLSAILGYGNMAYYNAASKLGSIHEGLTYPVYSLEDQPGLSSYIHNTNGEWLLLLRLLSGAAETQHLHFRYLLNPAFVLCAMALLTGIILCLRKKKWELPLILACPMLIIPFLNRGYEFCKFGRYLGFLIPIACLFAAFAATQLFRFFYSSKSRFGIWPLVFWLILPAGYLYYHFHELRKTYAVLQTQDPSMDVFAGISSMLKNDDKDQTLLLIDDFSWKASRLQVFLETDGWRTYSLAGTRDVHRKEFESEKYQSSDRIGAQVDELWRKNKNPKVIAIISPYILKPFLAKASYDSFDGCLATKKLKGNINHMLLGSMYYIFSLAPPSLQSESEIEDDPQLLLWRRIAAYLPDPGGIDPTRHKTLVPPLDSSIRVTDVKSFLDNHCMLVSLNLRKEQCNICEENVSSKTWDNMSQLRKNNVFTLASPR